MDHFIPLLIIVFFANLIESIAGFGSTLLALTFGAAFLPIDELIAILVPLNLFLSAFFVIRYYRQINVALFVKFILPSCLIGLIIGIAVKSILDPTATKLVFGLAVTLIAATELIVLFFYKNREPKISNPVAYLFLTLGGMMQGMFASGGPFIVYVASKKITDKSVFRSTLCLLWLLLNLVLIVSLVQQGSVNEMTLKSSAWLFLPVTAGMVAGIIVHQKMNARVFTILVYLLLFGAGASLFYRSVFT